MKKVVIWLTVALLCVPLTMCNVHYGNPQAVWLYCTMLGWCTP